MSNIKLKDLIAENMRRFRTKNLNETQLDMFNMDSSKEYFLDYNIEAVFFAPNLCRKRSLWCKNTNSLRE